MKKDNNENKKNGFSTKDIFLVILCVAAIIVLGMILKKSKETEEQTQQELSNINQEIQSGNELQAATANTSNLNICINEVNQSGWIELYNSGETDFNLEGYQLYAGGELIKTFQAEDIIQPQQYAIVNVGHKLEFSSSMVVAIKDKNNDTIHAIPVPELDVNESYGSVGDANKQMEYQKASKESENLAENVTEKSGITFSLPSGFYTSDFNLELSAPDDAKIYYTLDGTDPTTESTLYESPIKIYNRSGTAYLYANQCGYKPGSIEMGTVVRAIAVDKLGNVIDEKTQSYYISIANNSNITKLPVISITTDPSNLFDYFEGIYVNGRSYEDMIARGQNEGYANYLNGWTRTAHIEYFEGNKDKTYESEVTLSIYWDNSRFTTQKGFAVTELLNTAYEGTGLEAYINKNTQSFSLLTNLNDNFSKSRDIVANALLADTSVGTRDIEYCIVFIDGEYWGMYMLQKPYNDDYLAERYGLENEKTIFVKNGQQVNESYPASYQEFYNFVVSNDMSNPEIYEQVLDMMDMQSYLDYFCANMYLANPQYGYENGYIWRTEEKSEGSYTDGKWRWLLGNMDGCMGNTALGSASSKSIDTFLQKGVTGDKFFLSLRTNSEFRKQLEKTMKKMAEQIFTVDKVEHILSEISEELSKPAQSSYDRFFYNSSNLTYDDEMKKIMSFFEEREYYISVYTEEVVNLDGIWEQYIIESEEENNIEDAAETDINELSE